MDGFVLILAIIVFSVFKNVIQEAKKKEGKKSLPDVFDTMAEHDESQDRALEALRRRPQADQIDARRHGPDMSAANRINLDVIRRFMAFPDYQLKFVVDRPEDLAEIDALLAREGLIRPGGERRGNSRDRARRALKLAEEYEDWLVEGMKHGAYDYLMKPCDLDVLMAKLNAAAVKKREHEAKILEARATLIGLRRGD